MGGSFDPIHLGHLTAAEEAREVLKLSKVVFMPSGYPPHKDPKSMLPGDVRYAMTAAAVADNPAFCVSRLELDETGPSYTVDTLFRLQKQWPGVELYFITGADMFLDLPRWKNPERLLTHFHFVGVSRPGWPLEQDPAMMGSLYQKHQDHIHVVKVPGVAISATEIRQRIRVGRSVRYLIPDAVHRFIVELNLYT